MRRNWLAIGIILLFLGTSIIPAIAQDTEKPLTTSRGDWLYVGGSGPGNYTRIQYAIDNASNGDTIFVFNDSAPYYEHIQIDKSIDLIGEERNSTILDGNHIGPIIDIIADTVIVRNLSMRDGGPGGSGITCSSDDVTIQSCVLLQNLFGFEINHPELGLSQNIHVINNIISDNFYGIVFMDTIRGSISGNFLQNNSYGITIDIVQRPMRNPRICESYLNFVSYNTITDSRVAITINHSINNFVQHNILNKNEKAIFLYGTYGVGCGNNLERNLIKQNDYGIVMISGFLGGAEGNRINQNTFEGNRRNVFYTLWGNNSWDGNYWGRSRWLPYPIFGMMHPGNLDIFMNLRVPWVEFDRHPAQEPYES